MSLSFPIMIVVTLVSALGFALFFNVNKRHVALATLGGVFAWAINYFLAGSISGVFIPCMVASIFAAIYSETLSRIKRTPVAVFFVISVIPLIPGRALYYTMYNAVSGNFSEMLSYALVTLLYAGGIAVGICLITAIVQTWDLWAADKAQRLARMLKKQARKAKHVKEADSSGEVPDQASSATDESRDKDDAL